MSNKVWDVMNDLEMVTSKICSAREIIDAAIDRNQEHQYDKAETMMSAAYEFLGYYLEEFDAKFKLAWQETVVKQKKEDDDAWDAVNKEREYYVPSMPLWGHSDMEALKYSDEELNAMCDKAASDEDKVKRWVLPVQQACAIDDDGEYFINFPDDLLEAANLKEGDQINWVDNGDGSYLLRKVTKLLGPDEC